MEHTLVDPAAHDNTIEFLMPHQEFVDSAAEFLTNCDSHADKGRTPPLGRFASASASGAKCAIRSPWIAG
ncbi:MAG: hypothetical protein ACREX9_15225 [Gammaproteobacteria bacterium]